MTVIRWRAGRHLHLPALAVLLVAWPAPSPGASAPGASAPAAPAAATPSTSAARASMAALESQVKEVRLPNGLICLVVERHFSPIFSFVIDVDAGAVDEPAGKTGIAHMMEHMAFKGTPQVGTKDPKAEAEAMAKVDEAWDRVLEQKRLAVFHRADSTALKEDLARFKAADAKAEELAEGEAYSKLLEENGAQDLNAGTGEDETTYYCSLPSNKLELWAALEGSQMTYPVFREFYKEREVVIEERRLRNESTPRGRLREETMSAAFTAHPYRNGVIGFRSDLESFSRRDAEQFFRAHYNAANMCLVLVGDLELGRARALLEQYFGDMPSGPKGEPVLTVEPPPAAERTVRLREEAQPLCYVAFHGGPAFTDPEYYPVDALTDVLAAGRSSRLYTALVKQQKLATSVFCSSGFPGDKYPNLVFFSLVPAPGVAPDTLVSALQQELDGLARRPVTPKELDGYRARAKAAFVEGLKNNLGLARQLAFYQVRTGDWRNLFRVLDRLDALTPAEVSAQAGRIFTRINRTTGILESTSARGSKGGRS